MVCTQNPRRRVVDWVQYMIDTTLSCRDDVAEAVMVPLAADMMMRACPGVLGLRTPVIPCSPMALTVRKWLREAVEACKC